MMRVVAQSVMLYCAVAYYRLVLGLILLVILLVIAPFYFPLKAFEWTRRLVTARDHRIKAGSGHTEAALETEPPQAPIPQLEHYCQVHQTELKRFTKGDQVWYSPKVPGGKWYREK